MPLKQERSHKKKKKKIRFKGIFLNLKIKRQMLAIKLIKYRQGKSREREGLQVARNISDIPWEKRHLIFSTPL